MGKTCEKSQNEKRKHYMDKIKSDSQKFKELREKAAERMRKRRLVLAKNKNLLEQMKEKDIDIFSWFLVFQKFPLHLGLLPYRGRCSGPSGGFMSLVKLSISSFKC